MMRSTFTTAFSLLLTASCLLHTVDAHGRMMYPRPRLLPGDDGEGYTYARTANADPCQNLPSGKTLTNITGGALKVEYVITAAHLGGCTVYIDRLSGAGWESVGDDPTCGLVAHQGFIDVKIPHGTYKAVLRWYYQSNNNDGAMGEVFNNCADVLVSPAGSNSYTPISPTAAELAESEKDRQLNKGVTAHPPARKLDVPGLSGSEHGGSGRR